MRCSEAWGTQDTRNTPSPFSVPSCSLFASYRTPPSSHLANLQANLPLGFCRSIISFVCWFLTC